MKIQMLQLGKYKNKNIKFKLNKIKLKKIYKIPKMEILLLYPSNRRKDFKLLEAIKNRRIKLKKGG